MSLVSNVHDLNVSQLIGLSYKDSYYAISEIIFCSSINVRTSFKNYGGIRVFYKVLEYFKFL